MMFVNLYPKPAVDDRFVSHDGSQSGTPEDAETLLKQLQATEVKAAETPPRRCLGFEDKLGCKSAVCSIILIWGFPKIGGTPKWMVKIMEISIKLDDFGVPPFSETPKLAVFSIILI